MNKLWLAHFPFPNFFFLPGGLGGTAAYSKNSTNGRHLMLSATDKGSNPNSFQSGARALGLQPADKSCFTMPRYLSVVAESSAFAWLGLQRRGSRIER
jgi:hypothetical protein